MELAADLLRNNILSPRQHKIITTKVFDAKSKDGFGGKTLRNKWCNVKTVITNQITPKLPSSWKDYGSGKGLREVFAKLLLGFYKEKIL